MLARRVRVGRRGRGRVRVREASGELGRRAHRPHAARVAHLEAIRLAVAVGVGTAQTVQPRLGATERGVLVGERVELPRREQWRSRR